MGPSPPWASASTTNSFSMLRNVRKSTDALFFPKTTNRVKCSERLLCLNTTVYHALDDSTDNELCFPPVIRALNTLLIRCGQKVTLWVVGHVYHHSLIHITPLKLNYDYIVYILMAKQTINFNIGFQKTVFFLNIALDLVSKISKFTAGSMPRSSHHSEFFLSAARPERKCVKRYQHVQRKISWARIFVRSGYKRIKGPALTHLLSTDRDQRNSMALLVHSSDVGWK